MKNMFSPRLKLFGVLLLAVLVAAFLFFWERTRLHSDQEIASPKQGSQEDTVQKISAPDTPEEGASEDETQDFSSLSKSFLTIVSVSRAAGMPFNGRGWETVLAVKGTDDVRMVEIVMWDNGTPGNPDRLGVYAFDRSFEPNQQRFYEDDNAWVDYRESFNVANIEVPHGCSSAVGDDYFKCSAAYLSAFEEAFSDIVTDYPANNYALKYVGHGSTNTLFEGRLSEIDSQALLAEIVRMTGKKLAFLDWGYSCSMGDYDVVASQYRYADYIRASDVPRQGFAADWAGDYETMAPEGDMARFFTSSKSFRESLIEMSGADRLFWETKTVREDMTSKMIKQSVSIYDTNAFSSLESAVDFGAIDDGADVLRYIREKAPDALDEFFAFRAHYVDNRDFFGWETETNGFRR